MRSIDSSPAIGSDGTIYVTACGYVNFCRCVGRAKLAAITPQGSFKWVFKTPSDIKSSPALGSDGTIYFGSRDRNVYALDRDGKKKWAFETKAWVDASAAIGEGWDDLCGRVGREFYALNADGTKKWALATGGPVDSSAAIGKDGTIYFGSHDKNFYAVTPEGKTRWTLATGGAILSSPALDKDGNIYFTSVDGKLYSLSADGTKRWELWTGGVQKPSPVIDAAGNIYLGVNNTFWGIKSDGRRSGILGIHLCRGRRRLRQNGMIYFGGINEGAGSLFGFGADGSDKTNVWLQGDADGSPTIAEDGTIYVGAWHFHALKGTAGLAKGGWPKFRGGVTQTGRVE